jgi:hypothetical protein
MASDFDAFLYQLAEALVAARAEMFGSDGLAKSPEDPDAAKRRTTALRVVDTAIVSERAYAARLKRFLDVLEAALGAATPN